MSCFGKPWNGVQSPCKDCTKRHTGCHSECPDYKKFVEENDKALEAKYRESRMEFNPNVKPKRRRGR